MAPASLYVVEDDNDKWNLILPRILRISCAPTPERLANPPELKSRLLERLDELPDETACIMDYVAFGSMRSDDMCIVASELAEAGVRVAVWSSVSDPDRLPSSVYCVDGGAWNTEEAMEEVVRFALGLLTGPPKYGCYGTGEYASGLEAPLQALSALLPVWLRLSSGADRRTAAQTCAEELGAPDNPLLPFERAVLLYTTEQMTQAEECQRHSSLLDGESARLVRKLDSLLGSEGAFVARLRDLAAAEAAEWQDKLTSLRNDLLGEGTAQ